jgi:hypothetical protein
MAIKPVNLSSRSATTPLVDPASGRPTSEFVRWLNDTLAGIVYALNALLQIPQIIQALADVNAATVAAQTAANNAQAAANTTTAATSLANSYPTGATVTASDAGASATVSISSHTRVYGDGTSVSVASGSVTGRPYSTLLYVYYDDPARAGGTVTYATSTTPPAQTGNRHVVGSVTTPAAAGAPTGGRYVLPPGSGNISSI